MKHNLRCPLTRQFWQGNRLCLAIALLNSLVIVGANLLLSWMMQQLIDLAAGADIGYTLGQLALVGAAVIVMIAVGCGLAYAAKPRFLSRAMAQYKNYVFGELSQKGISAFAGENTARYVSALSNDVATIEADYLRNIFTLADNVLFLAGGLGMMLYYSPTLTLAGIALSVLPVLASLCAGDRMARAEQVVSTKNDALMATLKDCLNGFSVIKAFRAEAAMCQLFAKSVQHVEDAKCRRRKLSIVIQLFALTAGTTAQFGVFLVGAWLALSGRGVSAGVVLVFVQLMNYVIGPIGELPQLLAGRKAALALIDKLAAALAVNAREEDSAKTALAPTLRSGIALHEVSFAYNDGGKPVLDGITTRFAAGGSYVIVGASGSGKSTLLNLLMAGHDSYTGEITYDGIELRQAGTDSLYALVSLVQQNVFVFNASIRDNITMFSDFPVKEVNRAIALSGLSALIAERGEGYLCGENGSGLSGGEKQRIAIARSLLRRSSVLLVDEATSALDAQTARQVAGAILALDGLTRIVVTHTLDAPLLRQYDAILTLKHGKIAEIGSFDALMEKKGYFYSLYTVSQ